jgi:aminoglycoside phosphotransferase (APT) family kinase protein
LNQSLGDIKIKKDDSGLHIEPLAYTRSGSAISGVSKNDDYLGVYKDGLKRKLKEERQGVESWHEIYPGLAPKILSYKKRGHTASLLIEHLPGQTFEQILLNESDKRLRSALDQLIKTLKSVWRETHSNKPAKAHYMEQLQERMSRVYKIHPEFRYSDQDICGLEVPSFDQLVLQASDLEAGLPAPFSVYIHGDFNLDNIIYDPSEKKISFIDLHRSCYMDYVQDISVFMVSNYRLQILDAPVRRRIMSVAIDFYQRTRRTARKAGDENFDMRMALGLARSFASSTRFILDKSLARSMFLRARYLLEHVVHSRVKKTANYRLPVREIFVA